MKALTVVLLVNCASTASAALFGQSDTPIGSALASACAGKHVSTGSAGQSVAGFYNLANGGTCAEQVLAGGPAFANTGLVSGVGPTNHPFNASATGTASIGSLKLEGTSAGSAQTSASGGVATVGWNDNITLTGGTGNSLWVVPLLVHGKLTAVGDGALARMEIALYKNGATLTGGAGNLGIAYAQFQALTQEVNGTILYGFSDQRVAYGASDVYPPENGGTLQQLNIDHTIYFVVPFTYGQTFKLGIWSSAHAGQISSGAPHVPNTATFEMGNTITWNGKGYILDPNTLTQSTNFTINSQSGFDYTEAVVPEPSTAALLCAGVLGLFALRRPSPL